MEHLNNQVFFQTDTIIFRGHSQTDTQSNFRILARVIVHKGLGGLP